LDDTAEPSMRLFIGIGSAALAFALFLLFYLRGRHPFFRIPFWRVLIFFLYGGVVAPIAVILTYVMLGRLKLDTGGAIGAFLLIGPVEEVMKFAGPLLMVGLVRRWRDEPFEWFLAGAASGTGFAMTENIIYALAAPHAFSLLMLRSLAPMHLLWSGWFGYRIGRRSGGTKGFLKAVVAGFLIASFLHGMWDALCFSGLVGLLLVLFGSQILAFGWHVRKMSWLCANRSPRRPDIGAEAEKAIGVPSEQFRCSPCGKSCEKIALRGIDVWICRGCLRTAVGRGDLFRLVSEYSGTVGWFPMKSWYGFYWRDPETPAAVPCAGCEKQVGVRRFVLLDGPSVGFCDDCALATGDKREMLALPDTYRARLEEGFLRH
jgi:RsiW-degrading membrane proteinase PrsW (M82 family)